jgi:phytoene synthase
MVRRLLLQADRLYFRAEAGIAALPLDARPGIYAARHVYAGIGGAIARNGFDTVSYRARTYRAQKIGWLGLSLARAAATTVMPGSAVLYAPPLTETRFLVEAAARQAPETQGRTDKLLGLFADLEARDRAMRGLERTGA